MTRRTLIAMPPAALAGAQVLPNRVDEPSAGRFVRTWWFEKGMEHGNPVPTGRFRVNAPEMIVHPAFGLREEAKSSGMMQILVDENLQRIEGAELYLELWGGHPGTMHKRVVPNGRTTYWIPEVGSGAGNCTHQYPTVRLKITDLVPAYNAFQFACEQGPSFWGHYIVDQACVRTFLPASHADVKKAALDAFSATVRVRPGDGERLGLSLDVPRAKAPRVSRVDYFGFYEGYDENGSASPRDWHGFTKARQPVAILGSATKEPFAVAWDTAMLPDQEGIAVRAVVHFTDPASLTYETAAVKTEAAGRQCVVRLFPAKEKASPFWSRAGRTKTATIPLDIDPALIEKAVLHTVAWDGGKGNVREYFKLNGQPFEIAREGKHDVIYTALPVPPGLLKKGANEITLMSDTDHHGIEILEPGPALVVRYRRPAG